MKTSTQPHQARSLSPAFWALALLAYPLFFASGAAGLIYEVVWTRILLNTFGTGIYAICAVLSAFMAGLALGSWALGRASDRLVRPLKLYACLELGIGLCGLAMPWVLKLIGFVDGGAYRLWGQNFAMLTGLRFVLAFIVMLVPTTLMGATLPVLSRFLVRQQDHLGLHVGSLYATNTAGAVLGTFLAGFVLIAQWGVRGTEWIAVALNIIVGVLTWLLSTAIERHTHTPVKTQQGGPSQSPRFETRSIHWVLFTAFASGAVALAAQVLWSRSLVFSFEYLKNTTYAFSAMLTIFLAGLAIGSALIGLVIDHQREPLRLYGMLLTMIGLSIMLSVSILYNGAGGILIGAPYNPQTGQLNWLMAVANVMTQSFSVLGVPTLLMGMAFPVAARVVVKMGQVGRDVGRLYALNTLGAILGSIAAGFLIVPVFGLTTGLIILGAVDMVLGLLTIVQAPQAKSHLWVFGSISILTMLAVWLGLPDIRERGLQPIVARAEKQIFYEEGPLATVAVVENNLRERTIYVDGVGVAGTDPVLQTDQKSLAHVPMMLLGNPSSALTVGFGSGGASYSLMLHDRLQKVHCVEICETVPAAASTLRAANHLFFGELNPFDFAQKDGRYDLIWDDARSYLRYTDQRYDFIATDCTDLRYKSNANLYDLEYFTACRQQLTEEGIVVVWMPLAGLSRDMFRVALRTFHSVFDQMGIFFMDNEPTHYILLIGWQGPIELDYNRLTKTLGEADVRDDLAELYLDDPVKLLSCFITGGDALKPYLEGTELNTEDMPRLEFESPKYGYYDQPMIDNLQDLMDIRVSPVQFLKPGSAPPEALERLERYERALPSIIEGHAHYRKMELEEAVRCYMKALEITPEDLSLRHMLTFPALAMRVQYEPNNYFPSYWLGRMLMLQDKPTQAWDLFEQAERCLIAMQAALAPSEAAQFDYDLKRLRGWKAEIKDSQVNPVPVESRL